MFYFRTWRVKHLPLQNKSSFFQRGAYVGFCDDLICIWKNPSSSKKAWQTTLLPASLDSVLSPCCVVFPVAIISQLDQPGGYCGLFELGRGWCRRMCAQLWEEGGGLRSHRGWTCGRKHPHKGRVGGFMEAGEVLCESINRNQFYCCVGILLKLVVVEMFFTRLITMSKTSY